MARFSTYFKNLLNNMNAASKRSGGLGTILDDMQYGGVATPAVGSITPMRVLKYTVAPAVKSATGTHAAIAMTDAAQTITTGITNPDVPRTVTAKGNASGITGNVVINGTDINGAVIADTIALNGATEVEGVKAFKTVTSIVLPVEVHAGTDTVSVGRGASIGLPVVVKANCVLVHNFDGATDSGTATVGGATVDLNVFAVAGTMNGTKLVDLMLLF
jgi:hypothetical protein